LVRQRVRTVQTNDFERNKEHVFAQREQSIRRTTADPTDYYDSKCTQSITPQRKEAIHNF